MGLHFAKTIFTILNASRQMHVQTKPCQWAQYHIHTHMHVHAGPMYERYNCILRRWPKDVYKAMYKQGSTFTTTIYALVSAVQKLAAAVKMPDGLKLYRGLGGVRDLPDSFFKPHANGGKGFTEWGFMSTTSEKHVAMFYATKSQVSLPMVLELTVSAVDRGACIKELSQYPEEVEYLWVPCSFVAPDGPERMEVTEHDGVVRVVPVRVNSNLTAGTLDQILGSKKQTHLAAFRYAIQEVERDLSRMAGQEWWHNHLLEKILPECKKVLYMHGKIEAREFAKDEVFRRLVTEMLDVQMMAKSKMRLALEDEGQSLGKLQGVPLNEAHQELIHFLGKRLTNNEEVNSRIAAAMEICRLKGLVTSDADGNVEERIVSAAAEGMSSSDLKLLIQASGLDSVGHNWNRTTLSEALVKAVAFEHVHCIQVLLKAKADVNAADKHAYTPLYKAAEGGHVEVVKMLMEANADVNAADEDGYPPLCGAAEQGDIEVVRMLMVAKADVNAADKDRRTPLNRAAHREHKEVVRILMEANADLDVVDKYGHTALYNAAQGGHEEVLWMLMEAKADVNVADEDGYPVIYRAAEGGHKEVVSMLMEANADVNTSDKYGSTPLYKAAADGLVEVMRMLMEAGADVHVAVKDGCLPLCGAAEGAHEDVVRILIEVGADINASDKHGHTALYKAAADGLTEIVKMLIEAGANVKKADKDGFCPLYKAAEGGHVEVLSMLIEAGADVNSVDKSHYPPLCGAAQQGDVDVMRVLMAAGADVNAADKHAYTPLYEAAEGGHEEVVQMLIEAGASVNAADEDGYPPLCGAAEQGDIEVVRMLMDAKADVNAADKDGFCPLYKAAEGGNEDMMRILIEAGADINAADKGHYPPLCGAAQQGDVEMVRMLIEAGADVNAADEDGFCPLYKAAEGGRDEVVSMLMEANADVNAADKYGHSLLYKAAADGLVEVVKMLIEANADVNAADTPLCGAVQQGDEEVVSMLLEAGADVNSADKDGYTALYKAAQRGHEDIVRMLIEANADVMARNKSGQTLLMLVVGRQDWRLASLLVSQVGYEMLAAQDSLGWTCLNMIPAGCHQDEGLREWIKSVQAKDKQCAEFIRKLDKEAGMLATAVERFRGNTWDVVIKADDQGCCVARFSHFATLRASNYFCPPGSAAYYELHVLHMGEALQCGFCLEAFEREDKHTGNGVGDDQCSWGIDGDRLVKWHDGESPFGGRQWQEGDVIGLACDLRPGSDEQRKVNVHGDETLRYGGGSIWVSLNGDFSPPYGLVFHLDEGLAGLFAAFSSHSGIVRCNFGEEPFKHAPPVEGFKPMSAFRKT